MEALVVVKYEGLGNDFLILIDLDETSRYDPAVARVLCDRHRGIGADGLLRISSPQIGGAFRMELLNADGSTAETSGNGMRCAVLAAMHHGLVGADEIEVETVVGKSVAQVLTDSPQTAAVVRVDLGFAEVIRQPEHDLFGRRAFRVDVGNPHLVLVGDQPDDLDVTIIGPKLEHGVEGGQNVELATVDGDRTVLILETWERGAGYTLACGSGSCASAAAARLAGLVDGQVTVRNPGGDVVVELSGEQSLPRTVLIGEARRIATIKVNELDLTAMIDAAGTVA